MKKTGKIITILKFVLSILVLLTLFHAQPQSVQAQSGDVPFNCNSTNYLILSDMVVNPPVYFQTLNFSNGAHPTLARYGSNTRLYFNALGYNVTDNLIWGYDHRDQSIFRIDANYDITYYPNASTGLPNTDTYLQARMYMVGDVSPSGELYITDESVDSIYVVDVNPSSPTYLTLIRTISFPYVDLGDWAFHPYDGYIYTATCAPANSDSHLYRIDPDDGSIIDLGALTISISTASSKNFYAQYMDDLGNLYIVEKSSTFNIYQISDVANINVGDTISATSLSHMRYPGYQQFWSSRYSGDGARCINYSTDYGDAPDTYATTYRNSGAVHTVNSSLFMGADVSQENDAPAALSGTQDSYDDGVTLSAINTSSTSYSVSVTATNLTANPAHLYGWIDFDGDGVFSNSDERSDETVVTAGSSGTSLTLTWSAIPPDITGGNTYARVRLFDSNASITPSDRGGFGEVEDYPLTITSSSLQGPLPNTGFPPLQKTTLAVQPSQLAYSSTDMVLNIPYLGISETIVGVPRTSSGWNITWLGDHVGYLYGTAFPTWKGNTILTGHVWNADGNAGVFYRLKDLKYGDLLTIDAWGQKYVYEVRSSSVIGAEDMSPLREHSDYDVLTLITCKDFDEESGKYLYRVSVKAVLIRIED